MTVSTIKSSCCHGKADQITINERKTSRQSAAVAIFRRGIGDRHKIIIPAAPEGTNRSTRNKMPRRDQCMITCSDSNRGPLCDGFGTLGHEPSLSTASTPPSVELISAAPAFMAPHPSASAISSFEAPASTPHPY